MRISIARTLIAAIAAISVPTLSALAAAPPTSDTRGPAAQMQGRAATDQSQTSRVEQQITSLRAKLQILPAQQPLWDKVAQVMRENAKRMDESFQQRTQSTATTTAPETMASYAQFAAAHAQGTQDLIPPFTALYTSMSDVQKRATDQVFHEDTHRGERSGRRQGASR